MTDERMALIELIEKGADADLIRDMLAFAAERLMSRDGPEHAGGSPGRPYRRIRPEQSSLWFARRQ